MCKTGERVPAASAPFSSPLADTLIEYTKRNISSFHTPGHKGRLYNCADPLLDLTELPDTGSLYDGGDRIEEAEKAAAEQFGAARTLFSAGGCTLCIQTMLALAGGGGRILMARNAHRSALNAAALLGMEPVWIWPDYNRNKGPINAVQIEKMLKSDRYIRSVYITSPDYYGNLCDIEAITAVCSRARVPLLVDNAHGSHLGAFGRHPLALGAYMTADSAHKTLPVLTGGAYLHFSRDAADSISSSSAKAAMALFGSTSPSFMTLASLDTAQAWWGQEGKTACQRLAYRIEELKRQAAVVGLSPAFPEISPQFKDPIRLVMDSINGWETAEHFRRFGCEPEMADDRYVVFIFTPFNTEEDLDRLFEALKAYVPGEKSSRPSFSAIPLSAEPEKVLTPRQAVLAPWEEIPAGMAVGRIAARAVCPCPPGVAAIAPGERLSAELTDWLGSRGFATLPVVKEKTR